MAGIAYYGKHPISWSPDIDDEIGKEQKSLEYLVGEDIDDDAFDPMDLNEFDSMNVNDEQIPVDKGDVGFWIYYPRSRHFKKEFMKLFH